MVIVYEDDRNEPLERVVGSGHLPKRRTPARSGSAGGFPRFGFTIARQLSRAVPLGNYAVIEITISAHILLHLAKLIICGPRLWALEFLE